MFNPSKPREFNPVGRAKKINAKLSRSIIVVSVALLLILSVTVYGQNNEPIDETEREILELVKQGRILQKQGEFTQAESLFRNALARGEKQFGHYHISVGVSLNNLGELFRERGYYVQAEHYLKLALDVFTKSLGQNNPQVAVTLNNLGLILQVKEQHKPAEQFYQNALSILSQNSLRGTRQYAAIQLNLGSLYEDKGDSKGAEKIYKDILDQTSRENNPEIAEALYRLGKLFYARGDYLNAESQLKRATELVVNLKGLKDPEIATYFNNLAQVYHREGKYVEAERFLKEALTIGEDALGTGHPSTAVFLNNLAELYREKGDYERARSLCLRSLDIREKNLGARSAAVALSLNNLGLIYLDTGDVRRAEPLFRRSMQVYREALGNDTLEVANVTNNLAKALKYLGGNKAAERMYVAALRMRVRRLGQEHPLVAESLYNVGKQRKDRGDYIGAERYYQRARRIFEKVLGPKHPDVSVCLNGLAALYAAKGQIQHSIDLQNKSNDIREENVTLTLTAGSESQKFSYLATLAGETAGTISLHTKYAGRNPLATRLALTTILRRKGRVLDAVSNQLDVLRRSLKQEDQALVDQLSDKRARLAALILKGVNSVDTISYQTEVTQLWTDEQALESELSERSEAYKVLSKPITIETVQQLIPLDAALVEFVAYRPYNFRHKVVDSGWEALRYVAYVLTREGDPSWVDLGAAEPIDDLVGLLDSQLADDKIPIAEVKRTARDLEALVMQPIRNLIRKGISHLIVSPDGELNRLSFPVLVNEQNQFLIEKYTLTYLTSGRDLTRFQASLPVKQRPVILADPLFDFEGDGASRSQPSQNQSGRLPSGFRRRFERLGGTAAEARDLGRLLSVSPLTEAAATERALKEVNRPAILIVATHGFFLSSLNANNRAPDDLDRSVKALEENPLLRSGLALAGANRLRGGEGEDGILTALEASGLNLWGTRLVVLSACETGVGDVRTGEGVYGLRRALVLAGSQSQVMSLWQVDDNATKELMVKYFGLIQRGLGRAEALKRVQLDMLLTERWRHPTFWASFIHSGEWDGLDRDDLDLMRPQ